MDEGEQGKSTTGDETSEPPIQEKPRPTRPGKDVRGLPPIDPESLTKKEE
jgi:hypothetical protein